MPGIEELEARLSRLSDDYYGDKKLKREDDFMNQFGSSFNNDRNLGLAILDELDQRGVDTSAADEAVQQILNELRESVSALASTLGMVENKIEQKIEEIDKVSDAVNDALAKDGNSSVDMAQEPLSNNPDFMPMEDPNAGGLPPDMPQEPLSNNPDFMPMEDPNAGGLPPDMPMDMPPAEQAPVTLSDERMKRIKSACSKPKTDASFKPSAGLIEAAQRGW